MTKTKANNFRWKHGVVNIKASVYMEKSMYDADEVVRLMTEFAKKEIEKLKNQPLPNK